MIAWSLARPRLTLVLAAALVLFFGVAASRLHVDNTPENWLPADEEGLDELRTFRERFGDDALVLAFTRTADLPSEAWRADFAALADTLRAVPGVASVLAPARAVALPTGDAFEDALAAGEGSVRSPLERHLIGGDGRHAALAIAVAGGLDPATRGRLVNELEATLAAAEPRLGAFGLAGADVITHDLDTGTIRSLGGLAPVVLLLMCGVFLAATRSARAVGALVLTAIAVVVASLGVFTLAGRPMNLVVAVMPAILAVTTAAYATHLLAAFLGADPASRDARDPLQRAAFWREAMAATWRPSLLCALTTAAGFAALVTSEISPIRDLGAFTAIGVLLSLLSVFTVLPALLSLSERVVPRGATAQGWTRERAGRLTLGLRRRAGAILAAATVLTGIGGFGMSRLTVESHVLRFFPDDHRVPRSYREVEDSLVGLTPFELVVTGPRERMLAPDSIAALDRFFADALAAEPLLLQVLSPVAEVGEAGASPERRAAALAALVPSRAEDLPATARRFLWISPDGREISLRTTLTSRTGSSNECHALVERLRARLARATPAGLEAHVTGTPTLLIRGQVLLLDTQVRSFASSFGVITVIIAVAFRSLFLVVVSLIPNLLPLVLTLGGMGLLGIPLDAATVTVAGIALGLIVDDTIHSLHHYARARAAGEDAFDAVAGTLHVVGRAVLVTSVAVALGFAAFAISPFPPTRWLGVLMSSTALNAVACDFLVLPALLLLRARRGGPGANARRGVPGANGG